MHEAGGLSLPGAVRVEELSWRYTGSETPALDHVTLDIAPGETVVLAGGSGSGKSTLLGAMSGLLEHFAVGTRTGHVRVAGVDVHAQQPHELGRDLGIVLQHPKRQFFTDTVAHELAFASENFGHAPEQIRRRVATATDLAQLAGLHAPLTHLSGGQQQRVALAAATAHAPRVLLLDEPSSNLDAPAIDRLRRLLRSYQRAGITIVIAEHRLHYLLGLAHRVVVLRGGRVAAEWSANALARLDDAAVAREGLRPLRPTPPRALPPVPRASMTAVKRARPGLELRNVRCRLGGREVLAIDALHLPAGEVTAVCGPNGAGKSTLTRVVAGLQRHSGEVLHDGRRVGRAARRRSTGLVMQDVRRQLSAPTLREELMAYAGRSAAPGALDAVLEKFGLRGLAERHPLSLSGGEQQRAVIAGYRLAGRPVMLFDEPSSGVDRRHLHAIAAAIRASAQAGAVVLLITHDDDLRDLAADRQLNLPLLARAAR